MTTRLAKEKVTIQVAAKALGVSKGEVIQYMNEGRLTRIVNNSATYVLMDEIKALRDVAKKSDFTVPTHFHDHRGGATATIERDHYEGLLTRLANLEAEREDLFEYKRSLVEVKVALGEREKDLQETRAKLLMLEGELERIRKIGWWKRLFGRV
jgi:hypothetical protein